jgi:RNA polymerase sigma-70 factor (ECF subfamily)
LAALGSLTADDRDLLVMRAWDELTVTEMATLLDCSANAVSIRLNRARGRLATALGEKDPRLSRTSPGHKPIPDGDET